MKRQKELDRKITAKTVHNLSKNQGTLALARLFFQKTQKLEGSRSMSSGRTVQHFVTALATTDDCVLNMCVSVYTSFLLESVMLAGGRRLVQGGLWLTPQGLQGCSASALFQILGLSVIQ